MMPKLKQVTISSLKGVVIVEDFLRHKNILDNPDESDGNLLLALKHLRQKRPSKEIIKSTAIGTALKKLENHSNETIVSEAKEVSKLWKDDSEKRCQPTVEIRYDNLTYHIRNTSIKFFSKELGSNEEDEKLADIIEKEIFHVCKKMISKSYRKTVRKIIFVLRHEKAENEALKKGNISPSDFVKKYLRLSQK